MASRDSSKDRSKAATAGNHKTREAGKPATAAIAEEAAHYQAEVSSKRPPLPEHAWAGDPNDFQAITRGMPGMTDEAQVGFIRHGLSANFARSLGQTFDISVGELAKVLLVSESTLIRKSRDNALLDPSTSERMLRIAAVTALATDVFEDESKATTWMKRDNVALGGQAPLAMCDNDISAGQVRRVLRAIEYGGVA
jgi:putative toxin-antitoxin system antitoxin component (TIGR02293 family)